MKALHRLQSSSKWQIGTVAFLWVLGQPLWLKWGLTEDQFSSMFVALLAILGGQAAADLGKEKD